MITFTTNDRAGKTLLSVPYLLNAIKPEDLELDATNLCICLNSGKSNIIEALLPDASLTLIIDPTNEKIYLEKIFEDENEEIQIKNPSIQDITDEDKKMLLEFEEDYYTYRKLLTA